MSQQKVDPVQQLLIYQFNNILGSPAEFCLSFCSILSTPSLSSDHSTAVAVPDVNNQKKGRMGKHSSEILQHTPSLISQGQNGVGEVTHSLTNHWHENFDCYKWVSIACMELHPLF